MAEIKAKKVIFKNRDGEHLIPVVEDKLGLALFDTVLKDHVLTYEESKGLALQGTYVYKDAIAGSRYGYPDFYAKCLEEKNAGTATEVTLAGTTITMYIYSNGHAYYDIADKSVIDTCFSVLGMAWWYGIDTENERVFLPRNNWFEQATVNIPEINMHVEAGLPNIIGSIDPYSDINRNPTGAFSANKTAPSNPVGTNGTGNGSHLMFDASKSNSIYGKSNTVQPNAVKKLLYICVGNQVQDLSTIDIVTQVDNGVKEIDDAYQSAMTSLQAVGPVLKTGSTMTGDLTINKPTNSWPTISFISKGTMGETSDTVQYGARLISRDTRNQYFATYEHAIAENGRARAYMVARSTNDDGVTYSSHRLEVTCLPDGSGGTYIDGKFIKAFVTQTYVSGTSWYRVYSDGWCEQGGNGGNGAGTVTLLKKFINTNYNITATATSSGATSAFGVNVKSKATNSFSYYNATGDFMWRACGYIA